MIFEDPIKTLCAEIPAGWVYNPFDSTLTDFVFVRWDRPEELMVVHVRRASVPASRPDEEWVEKIRSEIGAANAFMDRTSNHGRAVAADFKPKGGIIQRVGFVRGPHVELIIEQRSTEPATQDPWSPLDKVILTSVSDANLEMHGDFGPEELNNSVKAANAAFEKNDDAAIVDALQQSIKIGTSAWLQSMATPENALEINASVRAAQAMAHLGLFAGNPFLLRDADFVLRRAQHSLEASGLGTDWAQELGMQISEMLKSIWSELLEQTDTKNNSMISPILALRERGFRLAHAAANAFEARDSENAYSFAVAAVDDLLSLISFLRGNRSQEIPEEIAAHLSEQGITDQEGQRNAIQKAREALLFPALNMAFQIRSCCALERHDSAGALETAAVHELLARLIFDENQEDAGTVLNYVLTMMDFAGSAALLSDNDKLDEATHRLDEAARILDTISDRRSGNDVWIRNHKRQIEGSLQAIDSSLQAAKQSGTTLLESNISALHSQFQSIAARFQEAAAKAIPPAAHAES
jgi:hypothetical protein